MKQDRYRTHWTLSLISSGSKYRGILFFFFLGVTPLSAQITAPLASSSRTTHYPNHPDRTDPIFIYCVSNTDGEVTGSLTARHPEDAVSDFDFAWRKYNPSIPGFDAVFQQETQVKSSAVSGLESGGYQVSITNGASSDTTLMAWIFINKPLVNANIQNFTCDYLAMHGDTLGQVFTYYDPEDHADTIQHNGIHFEWSSIPVSPIPYPTLELNPITWEPPYEDTDYYLKVIDWLGCQNEDSFFYHSIHVKPDFTPEPVQGEAPLEVSFDNTSLNAVEFEWFFGDDSTSILEIPSTHTYYIPDEYEVKLIARSAEGCEDSLKYQYIVVDPSGLEVPNVFTPNDDDWNDRFVVASQSLRSIYVQVFSRTGKKVYEFSGQGTRLQEWKGWDGKIDGGAEASPGVYFYIIRAVGWDDVEYKGKLYRGTVYLIREK